VGSHDKTSAADNLPAQTIVVFNAAIPDAESLAKFYAEKRGIAADHLVELDCPAEEEIAHDQARGAYTKRDDLIRCDTFIKFGKPSCALDLTRRVLRIVPESPAVQLLHKRESDLTPKPLPPTPHLLRSSLSNDAAFAFLDELEQ